MLPARHQCDCKATRRSCPARTPPISGPLQPTSDFDYSAEAYIAALNQFVAAVGLSGQQFAVIVHGFVLGQYGLLWALENDGGPLLLPPLPLLCLLLCWLLLGCCCCSALVNVTSIGVPSAQ